MPNYNFAVLNDKELEELVRDLLNRKFGLDLQSFKSGKDRGVDLRYSSTSNDNHMVVQVKHYVRSDIKRLLADLKKTELDKVKLLHPSVYWFVTSLELSATDKTKIKNLFAPYIPSANEVIGNEDLGKYLNEYPDLLRRWFKLWLTSSAVLNIIIHNAVLGRSQFYAERIVQRIALYVPTVAYNDALSILEKHKYVLISGLPGVGKTTMADLLTYNFLAKGFNLIYIDKDIREAESMLDRSEEKQLFYFDDFLGANYLEIINPKSTESAIVSFLERVRLSKNKYLILTTRTTILKTALTRFEKLKRSRIDFARKEIHLGEYSDYDKALILYNHLFQSNLDKDYVEEVFKNKNYWEIIRHDNYNPRLIEFFTNPINLENVKKKAYFPFILNNLENPQEIWSFSFKEQLTDEDRLMVLCLFTLGGKATQPELELAYFWRLEWEKKYHSLKPEIDSFRTSLKRLLDGYIQNKLAYNESVLTFINPSINDFLINFLCDSNEERKKLIQSCIYMEQLESIAFSVVNSKWLQPGEREKVQLLFLKHIQAHINVIQFIRQNNPSLVSWKLAAVFSRLDDNRSCQTIKDNFIYTLLTESKWKASSWQEADELVIIMNNSISSSYLVHQIKMHWESLINSLFEHASIEDDLTNARELFEVYGIDYHRFLFNIRNKKTITKAVTGFVDSETPEIVKACLEELLTEDDLEDVRKKVTDTREELFGRFGLQDTDYDEDYYFSDIDAHEYVQKNAAAREKQNEAKLDALKLNGEQKSGVGDDESKVENLFS